MADKKKKNAKDTTTGYNLNGMPTNVQSHPQYTEHPAIEASKHIKDASAEKITKRQNNINYKDTAPTSLTDENGRSFSTSMEPGTAHTLESWSSIRKKEARMYEILGSSALGQKDTQAKIKDIAQNNPREYQELMKLAEDIRTWYKLQNKDNTITNLWKSTFATAFDYGAAETPRMLAERILADGFKTGNTAIVPWGDDRLQIALTDNVKDATKRYNSCKSMTGAQLLTFLADIKKYYKNECAYFRTSIPDTEQYSKIAATSRERKKTYIRMWQNTGNYIKSLKDTEPRKYADFLQHYIVTPLEPMSQIELAMTKDIITYLQEGASIKDTLQQLDYAARLGKYNPLLKAEKK